MLKKQIAAVFIWKKKKYLQKYKSMTLYRLPFWDITRKSVNFELRKKILYSISWNSAVLGNTKK